MAPEDPQQPAPSAAHGSRPAHGRQRGARSRSWSPRSTSRARFPKHSHLSTLVFLALGRAHGHDRHRALGVALAAGARRVRTPRPAARAHRPLLRGPVRRQRPAVDHRRRRAARQPVGARTSARADRVRRGRARAAQRVRRARRCSCSSASSSTRRCSTSSTPWVALARRRASRSLLLGVILLLAGHPEIAGRFREHDNWMRFIGAVHVGVDRLRRRPGEALGVLATALLYQVVGRATVGVCAIHALDAAGPDRRGDRVRPGGRDGAGRCRSRSAGSASARACSCCSCTRWACRTAGAVGIGLLWYGMMLLVSLLGAPAFAVGNRHRAPATGRPPTNRARERPHRPDTAAALAPAALGGTRLRDGHVIYWWVEILAIARLLPRVLGGPERERRRHRRGVRPRQAAHRHGSRRSASTTSRRCNDGPCTSSRSSSRRNYFYGSLHFVVTIGVGDLLFRKWSDDYPLWRNTLAITTAIALIGFMFWPLMPPRLLPRVATASSTRSRSTRRSGRSTRAR